LISIEVIVLQKDFVSNSNEPITEY